MFPLVSPVETKYLFVQFGENWTGYFDNSLLGLSSAGSLNVLSKTLSVMSIKVTSISESEFIPSVTEFESNIIEYNQNGITERSIYSFNEGGAWKFGQSGEPYSFEDCNIFKKRNKKDRFTREMIISYLRESDLDIKIPLAERNLDACIIIRKGKLPPIQKMIEL
jgi:hypothetical protein